MDLILGLYSERFVFRINLYFNLELNYSLGLGNRSIIFLFEYLHDSFGQGFRHCINLFYDGGLSLSYRNQSVDLQIKPVDWCLYDRDLRHGRVKYQVFFYSKSQYVQKVDLNIKYKLTSIHSFVQLEITIEILSLWMF